MPDAAACPEPTPPVASPDSPAADSERRAATGRRSEDVDLRAYVDARFDSGVKRMERIEAELAANTRTTAEIKADTGELVDLMHSAKGAWKLLDLLGRIAKPVGALVAAGVGLWASLKGAGWNGGWGGK